MRVILLIPLNPAFSRKGSGHFGNTLEGIGYVIADVETGAVVASLGMTF